MCGLCVSQVHAGDVSYAGLHSAIPILNVSASDEWEPLWDVYGRAHEPFTRRRAYQLGIGNHESFYNWSAVVSRYPMAQGDGAPSAVASSARPPFWYTFESGGVHWTMLSTEHDHTRSSAQWRFADAALASINRTLTPWSVVAFHRPMYSTMDGEYSEHRPGCAIQRDLEPLLIAHGVDLVLTGHEHGYERIHPNVNGSVVCTPTVMSATGEPAYVLPRAPVHLLAGHGGAAQDRFWITPSPSWSAIRFSEGCDFTAGKRACGLLNHSWAYTDSFGWVHAAFVNRTHARLHTEMVSGRLHDAFWIVRGV